MAGPRRALHGSAHVLRTAAGRQRSRQQAVDGVTRRLQVLCASSLVHWRRRRAASARARDEAAAESAQASAAACPRCMVVPARRCDARGAREPYRPWRSRSTTRRLEVHARHRRGPGDDGVGHSRCRLHAAVFLAESSGSTPSDRGRLGRPPRRHEYAWVVYGRPAPDERLGEVRGAVAGARHTHRARVLPVTERPSATALRVSVVASRALRQPRAASIVTGVARRGLPVLDGPTVCVFAASVGRSRTPGLGVVDGVRGHSGRVQTDELSCVSASMTPRSGGVALYRALARARAPAACVASTGGGAEGAACTERARARAPPGVWNGIRRRRLACE